MILYGLIIGVVAFLIIKFVVARTKGSDNQHSSDGSGIYTDTTGSEDYSLGQPEGHSSGHSHGEDSGGHRGGDGGGDGGGDEITSHLSFDILR